MTITGGPSRTANLPLHGSSSIEGHPSNVDYASYGKDREQLVALERADRTLLTWLDSRLPYTRAEVVFAARGEMAFRG